MSGELQQTLANILAMSYGSHISAPKGGKDWKAAEYLLPYISRLLAEAEKRGAVRALREAADHISKETVIVVNGASHSSKDFYARLLNSRAEAERLWPERRVQDDWHY